MTWFLLAVAVGWIGCLAAVAGEVDDALEKHPHASQLKRIFSAPLPDGFISTGITRDDYLRFMADNIAFFKNHQNDSGAIIDPVSRGERQYSTPAFAAVAGLLVKTGTVPELLEPATRAMSHSLTALADGRTADGHSDFYIPLLVHAYRSLKDVVSDEQAARWASQFRQIDIRTAYNSRLRGMNWNIVSSSGELLRRRDELVDPAMREDQMQYLEESLAGHLDRMTTLGLFDDPGAPMAYDAFARLWLEDVFADRAYDGTHAETIHAFLRTGGLSTLLLLSPSGEWPNGGRSALHNWNEAQIVAICEINATYWIAADRPRIAGAFKRAAHLAFESMRRWQRPTGELWIVKNRAEPESRLGFDRYSNHSQYNLLAMAMLAIAWNRADETIVERPTPTEVGGYVFDTGSIFHKVAAAAGGYYVLIDTAADPQHNATGLQRVHKAGVAWPILGDSSAAQRAYAPAEGPKAAVTPGICWRQADGRWLGLADFSGGQRDRQVRNVALTSGRVDPEQVEFTLDYSLAKQGQDTATLTERYIVTADGVRQISQVNTDADGFGVQIPVLVSDGAVDLTVGLESATVRGMRDGSMTIFACHVDDLFGPLEFEDARIATRQGYLRRAVALTRGDRVSITIRLTELE